MFNSGICKVNLLKYKHIRRVGIRLSNMAEVMKMPLTDTPHPQF